jgi:hypothetical protein
MLAMELPSCPILIEDSIMGRTRDVSARSTRLTPDRAVLGSAPEVNTGSKEETTSNTGMARNLAISFRLARDLNSFEANAYAIGSSHKNDFP